LVLETIPTTSKKPANMATFFTATRPPQTLRASSYAGYQATLCDSTTLAKCRGHMYGLTC
jgi:hypothetical protein